MRTKSSSPARVVKEHSFFSTLRFARVKEERKDCAILNNKMPSLRNTEKGIPGKSLIYMVIALVIFGLAATNIILSLIWRWLFINKLAVMFFLPGVVTAVILIWLLMVLKRADRTLLEKEVVLERARRETEEAKHLLEIRVKARTKELQELASGLEEKVKERTRELQGKIDEMEKFQKLTVGREIKMVELKKEIKRLEEQMGKNKSRKG